MQNVTRNMQKICHKICKPVFNMQSTDRCIFCIVFCIYIYTLPTLLMPTVTELDLLAMNSPTGSAVQVPNRRGTGRMMMPRLVVLQVELITVTDSEYSGWPAGVAAAVTVKSPFRV